MKRTSICLALVIRVLTIAPTLATPIILLAAPAASAHNNLLIPASTYVIDRLTDANPDGGGEGVGLAGDLRYAIANAQSGDTITFKVNGTVELASSSLSITSDISIQGPGANSLIVQGGGGRVLAVSSAATAVISGLTISGGVGNGGGILNRGELTLNESVVSGNASGAPTNGGGTGSGIWNYLDATLTLNNSTVSDNVAIGNLNYNPSRGAGIANYGSLIVNNSTISDNSAVQGFGGGINNLGTLTMTNATLSGNSAAKGGGIFTSGGATSLTNVTLGNNSAIVGGAIFNFDKPATVTYLQNTLIADSLSGGNCAGKPLESSGNNLSSDSTCALIGAGDMNALDPLLNNLGNYGGTTQIHSLNAGSPAIDTGRNSVCPATDQIGTVRPVDGDNNGSAICDIGASEFGELTVSAGGPYAIFEGSNVTLNGSGSSGATEYAWDLDDDGLFDDATGMAPIFTAVLLDDGSYPVALRVSDGISSATATSSVMVNNVPPQTSLDVTDKVVMVGQPLIFTGSFTDPGFLDTHQISWEFGDGVSRITADLATQHIYIKPGSYVAVLTVADDDGGEGRASLTIQVQFAPANQLYLPLITYR